MNNSYKPTLIDEVLFSKFLFQTIELGVQMTIGARPDLAGEAERSAARFFERKLEQTHRNGS